MKRKINSNALKVYQKIIAFTLIVFMVLNNTSVSEIFAAQSKGLGLGKSINGFKITNQSKLKEYNSKLTLMIHEKTGAQLLYVENEDMEKSFGIGFKTIPDDNTGTNHIIEHALLNGSENFPVKQPFVYLLNNSMGTFINALTYHDFTVYVVASRNEKDYNNLMRVYLDSALMPNVLKDKKIFEQEGIRYETAEDGSFIYNGTVYNEMKGSYGSVDTHLFSAIDKSLLPDTPYKYVSGGNPENIPDLTYEKLLETYNKNYTPSNALIFVYGKQDINNTLKIINDDYLSKFEKKEVNTTIARQQPFDKMKELSSTYPVTAESKDAKNYLTVNYALCNTGDILTDGQLMILSSLVLGTDDSQLKKALNEIKAAESIEFYYDNNKNQSTFSLIFNGVDLSKKDLILKTIDKTFASISKNGIDQKQLMAFQNSYKYSLANIVNQPNLGIYLNIEAMRSFVNGKNAIDFFNPNITLDVLFERLDSNYLSKLIEKYFINNNHKSAVVMTPEIGGIEKNNELVKVKLANLKASLAKEELDKIVANEKDFSAWQQQANTKEEYATLPTLELTDLKEAPAPVKYNIEKVNGANYAFTNINTNGIAGLSFHFDASVLPQSKVQYASLLSGMMGTYLDTKKHSYNELQTNINTQIGSFNGALSTYANTEDPNTYSPSFVFNAKTLNTNMEKTLEVMDEIVNDTTFNNKDSIKLYLSLVKDYLGSALETQAPYYYSNAGLSKSNRYNEEIYGYSYYEFICNLLDTIDKDFKKISKELKETRDILINKNGLILGFTGDQKSYEKFKTITKPFISKLSSTKYEKQQYKFENLPKQAGFASATSNTQAVYQAGSYKKAGFSYSGKLKVIESIINYEYLWPIVRDKGGAYGSTISISSNGETMLSSYRDPNIKETLQAYKDLPQFLRDFSKSEKEIESVLIKSISQFDEQFENYKVWDYAVSVLKGVIDPEKQQAYRKEMLSVKAEDFKFFADLIETSIIQDIYSVGGSSIKINSNKDLFEVINEIK